uniref:SH2 domain-containing protein n=1 Tax=Timema tahoe TaxID=61484 RepID=A0A7R9IDK8_9NEOP|nr:unnamed protein product [Timema tahoe]
MANYVPFDILNGNPTSAITANNVSTHNKRTDVVPRKPFTRLVLPHEVDDTFVSALTNIRRNCSDSSSDYSDTSSWDTDFDDDKEQPETHEPDKKNVSNGSRGETRMQVPSTTHMMTHSKGSGNTAMARPDITHKPHMKPTVPLRPPILEAKPTATAIDPVSNGSRGETRMQVPSTTHMMTHSKGSGNTAMARPDITHKPHMKPTVPLRPPILEAKPTAVNVPPAPLKLPTPPKPPMEDYGHVKTLVSNLNLPPALHRALTQPCDEEEQYESIDNVDLPSREAIAALFNHSNTAKLLNTSQNQPSFFQEPRQSDSSLPSSSLHPSSSQEQLSLQMRRSPQPEQLAIPKTIGPPVPPTAIVSPYKSQITKPVPIASAIPSRPLPPHPISQSQPARSFPSQPQVFRPPATVPQPEEEQYECMEDTSDLPTAPNKNDGYISDEYESIKDNQFKIHFGVPVPNITDYYLQPVHKQKDNDVPPPLPLKPKPNIEMPSIRPPSPPRKKLEDQSSSSSSPGNSGDGVVTGLFGELLRKVRNRPATYTSDRGSRQMLTSLIECGRMSVCFYVRLAGPLLHNLATRLCTEMADIAVGMKRRIIYPIRRLLSRYDDVLPPDDQFQFEEKTPTLEVKKANFPSSEHKLSPTVDQRPFIHQNSQRPLPPTPEPNKSVLHNLEKCSAGSHRGSKVSNLNVTQMPWYHNVNRRRAEELLCNSEDGMFIIRPSQTQNPLTLSLWYNNRLYNISVRQRPDGKYALGYEKANEQSFASVEELVTNYQSEKLLLYSGGERNGRTFLTKWPQRRD